MAKQNGLKRAAKALATADGVAHFAFFWMFAWRVLTAGPVGKSFSMIFALVAILGIVADVVGWMLVKHGGRTAAGKLGLWSIALSTALAALLLVVGSWMG